jgi:hypothetical protein
MSDIYQGQSYDAQKETPGWDSPGYADAEWVPSTADPFGKPTGGSWADVTEKVRQAFRGGSLVIPASNQLFGDPAYGTVNRPALTLGDVPRQVGHHCTDPLSGDLATIDQFQGPSCFIGWTRTVNCPPPAG